MIQYHDQLVRYAHKLTRRKELAEELVQDLWLAVYSRGIAEEVKNKSYKFFAVALYRRFLNRQPRWGAIEYRGRGEYPELVYEEYEELSPRDSLAWAAINKLSPARAAVVAHSFNYDSIVDAAKASGMNYDTYKATHRQALLKMREVLCGLPN